jgi:hypothetical protein
MHTKLFFLWVISVKVEENKYKEKINGKKREKERYKYRGN